MTVGEKRFTLWTEQRIAYIIGKGSKALIFYKKATLSAKDYLSL